MGYLVSKNCGEISGRPDDGKSSTYNPYLKFLEPDAIKKGRQFYNRNQAIFESVEIRFKIPAGILVGLLHIESKLGDNTGRYQALGCYLVF